MSDQKTDIYRVLVVDDDFGQAEMVEEFLRIAGYFAVDLAPDLRSLWEHLKTSSYDIILLDYKLPDGTGLDALPEIGNRGYKVPVIMVTGQGDERIAVQAMQRGALDYVMKTGDYLLTLPALIRKTVRAYQLQLSVQRSLEQIRYQANLLNNVRDAIVVWDTDGRITYWNPAAIALFGWTAEERLGRNVGEVYLSGFNPPVRVPREGETIGQYVERQCETRAGQVIWVSSRITALLDPGTGNRLIGFMDVSHDITQRKQAEQALRAERNFVSAVLDTVGALVVVLDQAGRIVRFNRACEQIAGYSFAEVRGRYVWDLFMAPEEASTYQAFFLRIQSGTFPGEHETLWLTRSGARRLITWSNTTLTNRKGQIEYVIATGIDNTDRRKAEDQIQAAQTHLVQATRLATIGEMASGLAHQINNPLTTIIAEAQLLKRRLPAGEPGSESIEAIEQAGWRLQEAVRHLLEFSRPATTSLEAVSINQAIESAMELVGAHIEAAGVQLESQLAKGLPPVIGNVRQLEDLWVNLLLLARDATQDVEAPQGDGHWIRIISKKGSAGQIQVEVHDNGRPIPPDQLDSIFEPNFIGPTSGRGTGMELSICREIVRQHGGQISVEASAQKDTVIRVLLPLDHTRLSANPPG